ncbi:MAG: 4-hydroxythreonine-4-phosphate dehydrogenase PdxA [Bacteroidales bacterium]|nr:MAG: 4-hydroxythreonine-4-phosphate dehydrogenase PdxA [Bacteroidales bacterium]
MSDLHLKIGITHGDINGIGYEIIIKTLLDNRVNEICTTIVYGSPKVAAYHRKALNITNFSFNNIKIPEEANLKRANIINCVDENVRVELGKSTKSAGEASLHSLQAAVKDLKEGKIDILVTAPVDKKTIQSGSFEYPGHTEYLKAQFNAEEVLMIMVSDLVRVGVVTGHIPLSKVSTTLDKELIVRKLRIMNRSLIEDFTLGKPRIAVLGLNPHASDQGVMGTEEKEIIIPAIQQAKSEDILAFGPYPADGFFGSSQFTHFDGVMAMYHDQGLAPFKALVFEHGVNFTAGLPVIRTSPAHGTAFELAGKDEASPDSFRNALFLACDIYRNRKFYQEMNRDPLPSYDLNNMA